MITPFQPRFLHFLAAIGLTALGGCQGIKQSMPNISMPSILARGKDQIASADKPEIPAPQITERNFAQVQLAMGDSLAKEGNFEAAQAAYEAALRNDDKLARAYHRLALMHERTGKGADAKDLFQQAMKLDPKNAEIACDYGYYCYLRQDLSEAQKQFERALQLDPNLKRAHNNLGLVYARTGRPDHALHQFASAGLSPGDARANLGFVYLTQKRFPEAKAELQLAATGNSSSKKAQDILARFDKIETGAQPEQSQSAAASAPAAQPPVQGPSEIAPHTAVETPRVASEIQRLSAETPRLAKADAPHQATVASQPAADVPHAQSTSDHTLPTQQLAPVLSDYQF